MYAQYLNFKGFCKWKIFLFFNKLGSSYAYLVFDGVGDEQFELVDAGVHPLTALLLDQRLPDLRGTTHVL